MTGVVATPPMAPSEVMVMVEPDSSSRRRRAGLGRLGQPVDLGGAIPEVARLGMLDHRHHQARRRLRGNADMDAAMLVDDAGLVVEQRVDAGLVGDRLDHRPHQERQQRQLRPFDALRFSLLSAARSSSSAVTSISST